MIYTLTCNPSLDYFVTVEQFALHKTNRTSAEQILPGGKGLNVSMMLQNLGTESTALGFTAGFAGDEIKRLAAVQGIRTDFITLDEGYSRINIKLNNYEGTEINGMGPEISQEAMEALYLRTDRLQPGDILVMAGSIPASAPDDLYARLMERLSAREILFVVDTTGERLREALFYRPFLIKPNRDELASLFDADIAGRRDAVPYALRLREMGARNVLVSMAGEGAALADETGAVYESPAPAGDVINAVGAGDSMVAGFLAGWQQAGDFSHAFLTGLAAGSASAFSENFATKKEVEMLRAQLRAPVRIL